MLRVHRPLIVDVLRIRPVDLVSHRQPQAGHDKLARAQRQVQKAELVTVPVHRSTPLKMQMWRRLPDKCASQLLHVPIPARVVARISVTVSSSNERPVNLKTACTLPAQAGQARRENTGYGRRTQQYKSTIR